jgi:hypothetical protein
VRTDRRRSWSPKLYGQPVQYGFVRSRQPQPNATDGNPLYGANKFGIKNLPEGQASTDFPGAAFAATILFANAPTQWTSIGNGNTTQRVTLNTHSLVDNFYSSGENMLSP